MANWKVIADRLYLPLKSSPCRCCYRWAKGDTQRTHKCSRCVALELYDSVVEVEPAVVP